MAPPKRKRNATTNTHSKRRKRTLSTSALREDSPEFFTAECIKEEKYRSGKLYYLIKWAGTDSNGKDWEDSWEPAENANELLIDSWQKEQAEKDQAPVEPNRGPRTGRKSRVGRGGSIPSVHSSNNPSVPSTPARGTASIVDPSSANTSPLDPRPILSPTGPSPRVLVEPRSNFDPNEFDPFSQLPNTSLSSALIQESECHSPIRLGGHQYRASGVVPDSQSENGEGTYIPTQEASQRETQSTIGSLEEEVEDITEDSGLLEIIERERENPVVHSPVISIPETIADPIEDSQDQNHALQTQTVERGELDTFVRIQSSSQLEEISGVSIVADNDSHEKDSTSLNQPTCISSAEKSPQQEPLQEAQRQSIVEDQAEGSHRSELEDRPAKVIEGPHPETAQQQPPHHQAYEASPVGVIQYAQSQPPTSAEQSVEQQAQVVPTDVYLSTQDECSESIRPTVEHDHHDALDEREDESAEHASPSSRHDSSQESPQLHPASGEHSSSPIPQPPNYSIDTLDSNSNLPPRPRTPVTSPRPTMDSRQFKKELDAMYAKQQAENPFTPTRVLSSITPTSAAGQAGTRSPSTIPDRLPTTQAPTSLRTVALPGPVPEPEPEPVIPPVPETVPVGPEQTAHEAGRGSIPLIIAPAVEDEELSDAVDEDEEDDDDNVSVLNDELQLSAEEYIVPLFIEGRQRDTYLEQFKNKKALLKDFIENAETFQPLADIEKVIDQFRAIETNLDLIYSESQLVSQNLGPATATQVQFDARWSTDNSVKFRFLATLLHSLRDRDMHVVLVIEKENDSLINIIEQFCKAKFYDYNIPTKGRKAVEPEGKMLLTIIPSNSAHTIRSPDLIICLDGTQDADVIRKTNWATNTKRATSIPVLHLVIPRTVSHIERYVSSNLSVRERLHTIIASLAQFYDESSIGMPLDDINPRPAEAADRIVGWLLPVAEDDVLGQLEWPLPSIGSVKEVIDFHSQLSQTHLHTSSDPAASSKRPLDDESQGPAKRMRFTPQPQHAPTSTANNDDNEVTRISDSMPGTAVEISKLQEQLASKEQLYQREREARKEAEKQLKAENIRFRKYEESCDRQQDAHEELSKKYRVLLSEQEETKKKLEIVTKTADTLRDRLITRASENTQLESRRKALEDTLMASEDDKVARIAQLEKDVAEANDAKQKALKSVLTTESTLEYTKEQYRIAQDAASTLRTENESLTDRVTKAEQIASGELAKLKQRFEQQTLAKLEQRVNRLTTENNNLRRQQQAKEEEINRLKNSRNVGVGTRAQSVGPKTPRPGSRAASPAVRDRVLNLRNG